MAALPPFKSGSPEAEQEFWDMMEEKLKNKVRMVHRLSDVFFPEKEWNDLTDAQYELLTHYASVIMFETTETIRQRHEGQDDYGDYL